MLCGITASFRPAAMDARTAALRSQLLHDTLDPFTIRVKRRATGMLRHDYLVPGGPYPEQWDWDGFFIGMALSMLIPSEAIYLRNWAHNCIDHATPEGFVPGLLTPHGADPRLNLMKPVLAQGCFFASRFLDDWRWLTEGEAYGKLRQIVLYREMHSGLFSQELGLPAWTDSMESGADNAISLLPEPRGSVAAVDCSCFTMREYQAMAQIARMTGHEEDAAFFAQKAEAMQQAILTHLWCEEDGTFYNMRFADKSLIRVVDYGVIHPFLAKIASPEQAQRFFSSYLLNTEKLRSPFGVRTLSIDHESYNNANIIKPYSNWQGPVWPLVNTLTVYALLNYGYTDDARAIAEETADLCVRDIQKTGGMHENYDADSGEPLAAPNFVSWNLLLLSTLPNIDRGENPFLLQ